MVLYLEGCWRWAGLDSGTLQAVGAGELLLSSLDAPSLSPAAGSSLNPGGGAALLSVPAPPLAPRFDLKIVSAVKRCLEINT